VCRLLLLLFRRQHTATVQPPVGGSLSSPMAERKEENATGKGLKNKEFPFFLSVWYVLVLKEYIFIHSALG